MIRQVLLSILKKKGIKVPEQAKLDKLALTLFLDLAKLEVRSIEIDKDVFEDPWMSLNGKFVQNIGEKYSWSPKELEYTKYFPAFTSHYVIDRSSLKFSAFRTPFPPNFRETIRWYGTCQIVSEPENKF